MRREQVARAEAKQRGALVARATGPLEAGDEGPDDDVDRPLGIADAADPVEKVRASGGNR